MGKFLLGCYPKEVVLALREPILTEGELLAICAHKKPPDDRLAKGPPGGATSLGGILRPKAAPYKPDRPHASTDRAPPTSSLAGVPWGLGRRYSPRREEVGGALSVLACGRSGLYGAALGRGAEGC